MGWLDRIEEIVQRGKGEYLRDQLLQEAGDSLMMKLGEAANRLAKIGLLAPASTPWSLVIANRNFIIHQYDLIDRELTWLTLARDIPQWRLGLETHFQDAASVNAAKD